MKNPILLDTHALLWLLEDDKRLSRRAKRLLESPEADLIVSVASLWEIVVKHQAGKLDLDLPLKEFLAGITAHDAWRLLPITAAHIAGICDLPLLHKDPFDRILIAQARIENLLFLTADSAIAMYEVRTAW